MSLQFSVEGMNLDYLWMNLTGFSFYSIYCSYGYFHKDSASETGQVDLNDLIFAYHALGITILTVIQSFIYPRGHNKINNVTIGYLVVLWAFAGCYSVLTYVFFKKYLGFRLNSSF
jgi:cystinosin